MTRLQKLNAYLCILILPLFWTIPISFAAEKTAAPPEDPNVVATIGEYEVTKADVVQRFMDDVRPHDDLSIEKAEAMTPFESVRRILAEKAMIIDARKNGLLKNDEVASSIMDWKSRRLASKLVQNYLEGKITVSEREIQAMMKMNEKLDRVAATSMIRSAKAKKMLDRYYQEVVEKANIQKVEDNIPIGAKVHLRLLTNPKTPRRMQFIRNSQIREEMTDKEKNLVLATYNGGVFTLKEWFHALSQIAPPRRPRGLSTPSGFESFLDKAIRMPLLVKEAELQGLDKQGDFQEKLKFQEDLRLVSKVKMDLFKAIEEPNEADIARYYEEHKKELVTERSVKVEQIWCENRATAEKVRAQLEAGKDFEDLKQEYSLRKDSKPHNVYGGSEGMFFDDIYAADPNEVIGPLKGFYESGFKWRVVKVLEKKAGRSLDLSDENDRNRVKWKLWGELRNEAIDRIANELLEKYPHTIYSERLEKIDPLDVP